MPLGAQQKESSQNEKGYWIEELPKPLPIDFDQTPLGDQHFGTGGHGAELASDFDLFALGRLGEPLLETSNLLTALVSLLEFRLSFAKAQEKFSAISVSDGTKNSLVPFYCQ